MPFYVLLDRDDKVVHAFEAANLIAARTVMRQRCQQNRVQLVLAQKMVRGSPVMPTEPVTVDETNL